MTGFEENKADWILGHLTQHLKEKLRQFIDMAEEVELTMTVTDNQGCKYIESNSMKSSPKEQEKNPAKDANA